MNERLKELAKQAGFDAVSIVSFDIGQDLEKFAELIVRECARHITDQQDLVETNWQCKDGVHILYSLKEHFGVQE